MRPADTRAAWDAAFAAWNEAKDAFSAQEAAYAAAPSDQEKDAEKVWDAASDALYHASWALYPIPAPDQQALRWKAEHLFGEAADRVLSCQSWKAEIIAAYMADVRRLLPRKGEA